MNFRRIFEERNYDIKGHVLSLADTKFCLDMPKGCTIYEGNRAPMIEAAQALLDKTYPVLTATGYMGYLRTGKRTAYEGAYFDRRIDLLTLAYAEHFEGKGRFADAIVNLLWMILEETTWVAPAHNRGRARGEIGLLSHSFTETVDFIDLHAASTAADLSLVYFLVKDTLNSVTPLLCERLLYELRRRIITPFLDEELLRTKLWWAAVHGGRINNWNPWIISNILTTCAMTTEDIPTREAVLRQAMRLLDNFTYWYHDDGGCDEGPGYWAASCGTLYDCCCLMYDMTGGYVDMFDDPLLCRMGEYRPTVYVADGRSLNFADAFARVDPAAPLVLNWGYRVGSDAMITYGRSLLGGNAPGIGLPLFRSPYRSMRIGCMEPAPQAVFAAPTRAYLYGLQIAVSRQTDDPDAGLYLALKGGHNDESHNHCDVGQVIVFSDGKPLFIDAGFYCYTARSFGEQRYQVWCNSSDYHNVISANNCVQSLGKTACAKDVVYDETTGKLSMDLTDVYPKEANLASYVRSAVLEEDVITLTDAVTFDGEGSVAFRFLTVAKPTDIQKGRFCLQGCTVAFAEDLTVEVEGCDHTLPETEGIHRAWDTESLYRISLLAAPFTCRTFTLTVRK